MSFEDREDQEEIGQRQCFQVDIPKDYIPNLEKEPEDAFEYLRRVNYEAKNIPGTLVSSIQQSSFESKVTFQLEYEGIPNVKFDESHAPHPDYVSDLLLYFDQFRQKIAKIKENANISVGNKEVRKFKSDTKKWRNFCYEEEENPVFPDIIKLVQLDYVHTNLLFHHMVLWIKQDDKFEKLQSDWIYALLSLIEDPIQYNTISDMNELTRWLFLSFEKFSQEEKTNSSIILTILLSYFKVFAHEE